MNLTADEIRLIFELIEEKYGFGYSDVPEVGQLQAKLSIMLEMVTKREEALKRIRAEV